MLQKQLLCYLTLQTADIYQSAVLPIQAEDSLVAAGALAASHFGARWAQIAWSGAGILTPGGARVGAKTGDATPPTIPQLYARTLPSDPSSQWSHASFVPQVGVSYGRHLLIHLYPCMPLFSWPSALAMALDCQSWHLLPYKRLHKELAFAADEQDSARLQESA